MLTGRDVLVTMWTEYAFLKEEPWDILRTVVMASEGFAAKHICLLLYSDSPAIVSFWQRQQRTSMNHPDNGITPQPPLNWCDIARRKVTDNAIEELLSKTPAITTLQELFHEATVSCNSSLERPTRTWWRPFLSQLNRKIKTLEHVVGGVCAPVWFIFHISGSFADAEKAVSVQPSKPSRFRWYCGSKRFGQDVFCILSLFATLDIPASVHEE